MLEPFDNINPTSLGNYQIPAKYMLLDMSRNTSPNTIDNLSMFIFSNGHTERMDLSSIATANFVDKNLEDVIMDTTQTLNEDDDDTNINDEKEESIAVSKLLEDNNKDSIKLEGNKKKILITFPRQYIKLPSIDRIVINSSDETFQDTIFAAKFYDENLHLITTLNMEVTHQENLTISYKKFVYYNMTYYKDNKLPREFNFTTEYTKNNTYFKTFLFENKELSSKVKNNVDGNLDELNAYYYSNDKNFSTLKSYYSRINQEEQIVSPLYGLSPELNTEMITNNQDLSNIMKELEKTDVDTNYRDMFNKINENIRLDTSSGVKFNNGSYLDNSYSSQINPENMKNLDFYRGEKIQFTKKPNYKDYNNTARANDLQFKS